MLQVAETMVADGRIGFDDFVALLEQHTDVARYRRRLKCEHEGNYLEAGRAFKQLDVLRKQEIQRQQKAMRARQLGERQDVQEAHDMQFQDFTAAWDKYLEEYDRMAQMYIQQMTERHAVGLLELQQRLQKEAQERLPKWSKELLDWRRRQHLLARQHNYAEAQKVKKIADQLEESEREAMHESHALYVGRKEAGFRAQQQAELQALLMRIDARRREHLKQRALDSKRLLQRNRNVQAVLEAKQSSEGQRLTAEIRKTVLEGTSVTAVAAAAAAAAPAHGAAATDRKGRRLKKVCQLDVNAEAEGMFEALLRIMASEVAFEVHRALHTGEMSLEDLYAEKRSGDALGLGLGEQRAGLDVFGRAPPREPSGGVTCPTCGRQVPAACPRVHNPDPCFAREYTYMRPAGSRHIWTSA
ncbi:hypothetical protein JKP88DRAFT_250024 [Tribonema minus]|uniref:Uncharacterized protein n=1 Tax=Tribonema minus TaxID=303371 RepID=A0A836C7C9_9STRA|nr:hypothetical protein JKP88DRAFT_250024 [Tribonema minus]